MMPGYWITRPMPRLAYAPPSEPGRRIDVHDLPLVSTDPGQRFRDEQHPFEQDDDGEPLTGPMAVLVHGLLAAALVGLGLLIGWLMR